MRARLLAALLRGVRALLDRIPRPGRSTAGGRIRARQVARQVDEFRRSRGRYALGHNHDQRS